MKDSLHKINLEVAFCKKCPLSKSRKNAISGEGGIQAKIFIIGEAPGKEEDVQKKPFVGRSGKILNELLASCNLTKKKTYITNTVKCRPPHNRAPRQKEIEACKGYLYRQIMLIKPSIIVTLGTCATFEIFQMLKLKYNKISILHGAPHRATCSFGKIKVIPTYHPAAALRSLKILNILKNDFKINFLK